MYVRKKEIIINEIDLLKENQDLLQSVSAERNGEHIKRNEN